jgi:diaminohydroxyphosphoribosylaminopyrimidine deaminase / 5-amino-6-(5-phosphoribosylamino)uracil reductase
VPDYSTDQIFMKRCLQLAFNGKATCAPNPMVGAVVVHKGIIIGEGWHRKAGELHAEPNAICSVKEPDLLKESTLYVNLEPCSHYGKTPPCADLIIDKHIPRVVIGSVDACPLVAGKGISRLQAAGIHVTLGVEEAACLDLNRAYFNFFINKRPYVILKWAQTADGFMDIPRVPGDQSSALKISTLFTQLISHKLRSECDAILVGTKTAVLDNPSLNVRVWTGNNPVRVVIDRDLILPADSNLLNGEIQTIVFTEKPSRKEGNISWIHLDFKTSVVEQLLNKLYTLNIHTLLVEGGAFLLNTFLKSGLWNEIHVETSSLHIDKGVFVPDMSGITHTVIEDRMYDAGENLRSIRIYRKI